MAFQILSLSGGGFLGLYTVALLAELEERSGMAAGRDMAIEGPPGTGKSQTITNMIATALALGKRVLFVAEKQAALRVVSDRLRAAGFGPLLLELHADKANRTEVYAGVKERLEARPNVHTELLEQKRAVLIRHRDTLRRYLSLIRTPLGKLRQTAYALAWREIRLRELFTAKQMKVMESRWSPAQPLTLDHATLTQNRELLAQFGQALLAIDQEQEGGRTKWVLAERLDPFNQSNALDAAEQAVRACNAVADVVARLVELGVEVPSPTYEIEPERTQLAAIVPLTCFDETIVRAALHNKGLATEILNAQREWRKRLDIADKGVEHPEGVSIELAENLRNALAIDRCPPTFAKVVDAKAANEKLASSVASVLRDVERVSATLAIGGKTPVSNAQRVASVFAALGQTDAAIRAILSTQLLDPAADRISAWAARDANALLAERGQVSAVTQAEALLAEPSELDDIAETMETAGAFARMFGGRYKAARRHAARILVEISHPQSAAAQLRRVAASIRAQRLFREECKARNLFPAMLWDGVDSDFASLCAAHLVASSANAQLSALDETDVLQWWLKADTTERQTFSASCQRLDPILSEAAESEYSGTCFADLPSACAKRIDDLQQIIETSQVANVRPNALFQQESGETIADAVVALHAAREGFENCRRHPDFAWVGDVAEPLLSLETSLTETGALSAIAGPADLSALLMNSEAPVALVSALVASAIDLSRTYLDWESASNLLWETAALDTMDVCDGLDWAETGLQLDAMSQDRNGASLAADLLKYRAEVKKAGLSVFAAVASSGDIPPERLADMYELLATSALLKSYLGGDGEALGRLGSLTLEAARQSFKRIDKELHKLEAAAIVAKRVIQTAPVGIGSGRRSGFTELRLLEHETGLGRPRTPLRDVVHRAGQALSVLKPVWMMSPTSIAQFIRPGSLKFDLLIVDEASQMRPEFSVSCILRADQFVVVGDANQLPPSDHFQVASTETGDDEDDGIGVDERTESILDLAKQRFLTKPRLRWHYRSQHESLIQFSNREFYDRDLVIFPSPMANDDAFLGVKCFYTPNFYPDTLYESSINQREAELIIEQAFGLMQTNPERSIGIVAMNSKQTELIKNEFERLIVEEERVRKYVEAFADTLDEFFIKNLENVQGDERDVILISTVYGPNKAGVVRQNFGLMNREVGWRRLNVLVTRAKMSCRLITSLRPDDVKVTDGSSRGVIAFKSYLTYAHGGAQYDDASGGEADSDFEIFVADALRSAGYEVVYQVGVEKFRIDLAVRHQSCPVGFIAGIECDGAAFHSGLTVRDRDHIRQTILENLGWNIYRVWSTDWFADPARETAKLLAWLDTVKDRITRELGDLQPTIDIIKPKPKTAKAEVTPRPDEPAAAIPEKKSRAPLPLEIDPEVSAAPIREPRGRKLQSLGDFETYEAVRGKLYEIWRGAKLLGHVEVIKRATAAPRLYGDRALTAQSEYEGRVEADGDCFVSYDLYAAMREVARRATDGGSFGEAV